MGRSFGTDLRQVKELKEELHSLGSSPATLHSTTVPNLKPAAETAHNARALPKVGRDLGTDLHKVKEL